MRDPSFPPPPPAAAVPTAPPPRDFGGAWLPRDGAALAILLSLGALVALPVITLSFGVLISFVGFMGSGPEPGTGLVALAILALLVFLPVAAVRFYQGPPPGPARRLRLLVIVTVPAAMILLYLLWTVATSPYL